MQTDSTALITVYHFNSKDAESYERLVRGLRSTSRQLGDNDRLILVANGIRNGAEDPDRVLRDVDASHPERIVPIVILDNAKATGGLNVGVTAALRQGCDWIGSVQSSVVIGANWLDIMRSKADPSAVDGLGGRLVYEDRPDTIWTDGHVLKEGRTWDISYDRPLAAPEDVLTSWKFPCLSAALYSKQTVRAVTEKYGNFVAEQLPHYGDCPDVALRCANLGLGRFVFVPGAIGTKRRPNHHRAGIICSQLLAAQRYYQNCYERARKRVEQLFPKDSRFFDDAVRWSEELRSGRYSPTDQDPPLARKAQDNEWGR